MSALSRLRERAGAALVRAGVRLMGLRPGDELDLEETRVSPEPTVPLGPGAALTASSARMIEPMVVQPEAAKDEQVDEPLRGSLEARGER
jgi:hypothetical protein